MLEDVALPAQPPMIGTEIQRMREEGVQTQVHCVVRWIVSRLDNGGVLATHERAAFINRSDDGRAARVPPAGMP